MISQERIINGINELTEPNDCRMVEVNKSEVPNVETDVDMRLENGDQKEGDGVHSVSGVDD